MIVWRPGEHFETKSVDAVLREQHEQAASSIARSIAARTKKGIPLDDGDGPLRPLDDYEPNDAVDGVTFVARAISFDEHAQLEQALRAAVAVVREDHQPLVDARARVLTAAVVRIDGVCDQAGRGIELAAPWSEAAVALLAANGLLTPVTQAAMHIMVLRGEARKNCGALQPSISLASTATHARPHSEGNGAATVAGLGVLRESTTGNI